MSLYNMVNSANAAAPQSNAASRIPPRSQIAPEFKWRLEDIFADDGVWEREHASLSAEKDKLASFRGKLADSAAILLECLRTRDDIISRCQNVYVYAKMRRDEDNAIGEYQAYADMALSLYTEVSAICSFIAPELLRADRATIESYIAENEGLSVYAHYIGDLFRQRGHILSDREEEILALAGEPLNSADDIYTMLTCADMKFPDIKDESGNDAELSEGRYIRYLENPDRGVRERAFNGMYGTYAGFRNTIAASLSASIKKDKFLSGVRKYGSSIEMSLDENNIPIALYDRLIETIDANLGLFGRYLRLRKRALGLSELRMFDLYVPIVSKPERVITYDQAKEYVCKGLAPLGAVYTDDMKKAFADGWIDVYENANKTNGAYCWGSYLSHPYVLLNYQSRLNDVLTLAHELGHAMHSYYTNKTQAFINSDKKIFVAEVASTVNESLLIEHLIKCASDRSEKAYLLNLLLESIRGTLFRQTMFAEFERIVHGKMKEGAALTPDVFSSIYKGLVDKYFASEVSVNPEIAMEWARIPHFYTAFYVYQYATGISAAMSITRRIKSEGAPAVDRYLRFLAGGGGDYPLELLRGAGVDYSTPEPVEGAMRAFEEALNELENLI